MTAVKLNFFGENQGAQEKLEKSQHLVQTSSYPVEYLNFFWNNEL